MFKKSNNLISDAALVAAGGLEPSTDTIIQFLSDLERLLEYQRVT